MPVSANVAPDPSRVAWLRAQAAEFDTRAAALRLTAAAAVVTAYHRREASLWARAEQPESDG